MSIQTQIERLSDEIGNQADLIAQIKLALNGKAAGGGELYTQTGYIQFKADMRFDTGIICNQNTKIKVVFTRDSDSAMYMFGVVNTGNTASVTAYLSSGGAWKFGAKSQSITIAANEELVQTAIVSKAGIVRVYSSATFSNTADFEAVGSLIIGGVRNASGTLGAAQFIGKIYEFKIYDGDELIRDYIPCIDYNGVYCFYDNVTETFNYPIEPALTGDEE